MGETLEATGHFAARGVQPGAPWVPQAFTWRGATYEVVRVEDSGRRLGPALESSAMAPYVRGHRLLLWTAEGPLLLVEGLRGSGGEGRWRALRVWDAAPP